MSAPRDSFKTKKKQKVCPPQVQGNQVVPSLFAKTKINMIYKKITKSKFFKMYHSGYQVYLIKIIKLVMIKE